MIIRSIQQTDSVAWQRMRQALWPSPAGDHAREIAFFFSGSCTRPAAVFIAIDDSAEAIGFVELAIRPYAERCHSGRVAYLEGWFIEPAARGKGIGAALVRAAEDWGRAQGCSELASDTELTNVPAAQAHEMLGFTETERIICYRKAL